MRIRVRKGSSLFDSFHFQLNRVTWELKKLIQRCRHSQCRFCSFKRMLKERDWERKRETEREQERAVAAEGSSKKAFLFEDAIYWFFIKFPFAVIWFYPFYALLHLIHYKFIHILFLKKRLILLFFNLIYHSLFSNLATCILYNFCMSGGNIQNLKTFGKPLF